MMNANVVAFRGREAGEDLLTELLRTSAQQLMCKATKAELQELLDQYAERQSGDSKAYAQ